MSVPKGTWRMSMHEGGELCLLQERFLCAGDEAERD